MTRQQPPPSDRLAVLHALPREGSPVHAQVPIRSTQSPTILLLRLGEPEVAHALDRLLTGGVTS
jgi:hypothetical protein